MPALCLSAGRRLVASLRLPGRSRGSPRSGLITPQQPGVLAAPIVADQPHGFGPRELADLDRPLGHPTFLQRRLSPDAREESGIEGRRPPPTVDAHDDVRDRGLGDLAARVREDHVVGVGVAGPRFLVDASAGRFVEEHGIGRVDRLVRIHGNADDVRIAWCGHGPRLDTTAPIEHNAHARGAIGHASHRAFQRAHHEGLVVGEPEVSGGAAQPGEVAFKMTKALGRVMVDRLEELEVRTARGEDAGLGHDLVVLVRGPRIPRDPPSNAVLRGGGFGVEDHRTDRAR